MVCRSFHIGWRLEEQALYIPKFPPSALGTFYAHRSKAEEPSYEQITADTQVHKTTAPAAFRQWNLQLPDAHFSLMQYFHSCLIKFFLKFLHRQLCIPFLLQIPKYLLNISPFSAAQRGISSQQQQEQFQALSSRGFGHFGARGDVHRAGPRCGAGTLLGGLGRRSLSKCYVIRRMERETWALIWRAENQKRKEPQWCGKLEHMAWGVQNCCCCHHSHKTWQVTICHQFLWFSLQMFSPRIHHLLLPPSCSLFRVLLFVLLPIIFILVLSGLLLDQIFWCLWSHEFLISQMILADNSQFPAEFPTVSSIPKHILSL